MIVVYHKNNRISKIVSDGNYLSPFDYNVSISKGICLLATLFPESKIVWCKEEFQDFLNLKDINSIFHHNKMMLSYLPNGMNFLGRKIGYVEQSLFIKMNKNVSYPTWQMSSIVGVVHASLLIKIKGKIKQDLDFDYYLNSVAKVCMPLGLLCYSEPKLLSSYEGVIVYKEASIYTLFKFVKQHYKKRWLVLLILNLMVFEKQFPLLPFGVSIFYKTRKNNKLQLNTIPVQSTLKTTIDNTIDVIIPTIGRKKFLYAILQDLSKQTHLPINVIIVEQNPLPNSISELDYLTTEIWPFKIKHTFIHQAGACNARNLALSQVESEWVFFADDDIRIEREFVEKAFINIKSIGAEVVSICCLQKGQRQIFNDIFQWGSFGSGCSFVNSESLKDTFFSKQYEFGYGEDSDFGMMLRNNGHDVIYLPEPKILHLKAPIGGFRTESVLLWQKESIQPKPSPTVMLYRKTYNSREQLRAYKTTLFFKYYKYQDIKNPYSYFKMFQKQWNQSVLWANKLNMLS
ncbi:glycosyltransferase family 2 protein [Flavobacterium sp. 123]|uniref:glycosyltransferase family 2 protein n=1 Tax=Flavobacterium sp. 123 TaxID=2135627 RepID=UPI000EACC516|nr:glycosyltransferase family A protein [Flavobacterium sp. 123]RKT00023.1 GT2 family glycosyltransferase [Flavobacterium sp. 123]